MFRKLTASAVLFLLVALLVQPAFAAAAPTTSPILDKLGLVEVGLYGQPQAGALLKRLEKVETDLNGQISKDAILVRIDNLANTVLGGNGASLLTKVNAVEWMLFQTQTAKPLVDRVKDVEEKIVGTATTGKSLADRIQGLLDLVWPGGVLNIKSAAVPPGTKIKARLTTELKSASSNPGDELRYEVTSDVMVGDTVVIPVGSVGIGKVTNVKKAGPFGQSGAVTIDTGAVRAIDGTSVYLTFQQTTSDKANQSDLAAGASLGGMVLLGPLGLAAGYLVQGKSETIPAGTELTLEVKDSTTVQGISLTPGK